MKNAVMLYLVFATCLIGCSATETGTQIDLTRTTQLVKGKTTRSEVHEMFGDPQHKSVRSDGETWTYIHTTAKSSLTGTGVALGVLGVGSQSTGETHTQTLTTTFQGDVLADFSYTEGGQGSKSSSY